MLKHSLWSLSSDFAVNPPSPASLTSSTAGLTSNASTPTSSSVSSSPHTPPGESRPYPWYRTRNTINIAINYYQTLTILTKHTTLPSLVASILEVAKLSNISKGGVGLECVGTFFRPFSASYAVIVFQPILVLIGVAVMYLYLPPPEINEKKPRSRRSFLEVAKLSRIPKEQLNGVPFSVLPRVLP